MDVQSVCMQNYSKHELTASHWPFVTKHESTLVILDNIHALSSAAEFNWFNSWQYSCTLGSIHVLFVLIA